MTKYCFKTENELVTFAHKFAQTKLMPSSCIAIEGGMGAGKTVFVKAICEALGFDPYEVTSPTYALVHQYTADWGVISHFDLYRLGHEEEFDLIGGYEFLKTSCCLIEWPNLVKDFLPAETIWVSIKIGSKQERIVEISE